MKFFISFVFIYVSSYVSKSYTLSDKIRDFGKDLNDENGGPDDYTNGDYHQHNPVAQEYYYSQKPIEDVHIQESPAHQYYDEYKEYSPESHNNYNEYEPVKFQEDVKHSSGSDDYEDGSVQVLQKDFNE